MCLCRKHFGTLFVLHRLVLQATPASRGSDQFHHAFQEEKMQVKNNTSRLLDFLCYFLPQYCTNSIIAVMHESYVYLQEGVLFYSINQFLLRHDKHSLHYCTASVSASLAQRHPACTTWETGVTRAGAGTSIQLIWNFKNHFHCPLLSCCCARPRRALPCICICFFFSSLTHCACSCRIALFAYIGTSHVRRSNAFPFVCYFKNHLPTAPACVVSLLFPHRNQHYCQINTQV